MVDRIVSFALSQRLMVIVGIVALGVWGVVSFGRLPIDAYPDLSPPHVEIVTQWPGHAAEEVERLITIPIEVEMNGISRLDELRSISLYGLSSITMNFDYDADPYFAREQGFERLPNATLPNGITPVISPLFSPSGLIYRYVLQSADRTPQELKTIEDWVLERRYRSVEGVADDSSMGGTTMQYQVLLRPDRLFAEGVSLSQVAQQVAANNANAGGGFYSQGGQFYYVRGVGLVRTTEDIGNIIVAAHSGIPIRVRDLGDVTIGHAPRLGEFGYMDQDDAVEGVILMRAGEQAQVVLKRVEQATRELNDGGLPPDVKVVPFYDRQYLLQETTETVERNLLRGMVLVLVVLGLFLLSVRTALIVAVTIPFSLLFAFICLDWRNIPANLLSIGAIDFGILVDGAVVMVENVYRRLAARDATSRSVAATIIAAAAEVDRPIFYAVAVIIASFLPIYVLSGPSGKLFKPMADTTIFALVGGLAVTLTLLPVLCAWFLRRGVRERRNAAFEWIRDQYARGLAWTLARARLTRPGISRFYLLYNRAPSRPTPRSGLSRSGRSCAAPSAARRCRGSPSSTWPTSSPASRRPSSS
jgi:cobalt-zinc-cadmium resistance protein CzcA